MKELSQLYIDIGSTNIKWGITRNYHTPIKEESTPFPKPSKQTDLFFEVPIEEIVKSIQEIIDKNDRVDEIYISTQMHGYLLLDEDYKTLTPYISWRDHRSKALIKPFHVDKKFGVAFKTNLPRASVMAIKETYPSLMNRVKHFFTLGSYIGYYLTGHNKTHITDAAPTGFYSVVDNYIFETTFNLPDSSRDVVCIGKYLNKKVYTPIGDQQASVYAIQKDNDGYILNLGTAAQLCVIEDHFIEGEFETRPYLDRHFLCTITGLIGGAQIKKEGPDLIDTMVKEYKEAIDKLPKRDKIIVIGGVIQGANRGLIEKVLNQIGIPYVIDDSVSALDGLNKIAIKVNKMNDRKTGMMISEIAFPNMPLLIKQQGMNFVIIDCEHGGFDYKDVSQMIMNARLSQIDVFVRLANNDRKDIQKFLDMGADGLILPMTNKAFDIEKVVHYAKYSPLGKRGVSTMRAHSLYNPSSILDYMEQENKRVKVFAQIETIDGLNHLDEIASVNGLEGLFVGPNDLSDDYGCLSDNNAIQIIDGISLVSKACKKNDKTVGIITTNLNYLKKAKDCHYDFYSVGSELSYIKDSTKNTVKLILE